MFCLFVYKQISGLFGKPADFYRSFGSCSIWLRDRKFKRTRDCFPWKLCPCPVLCRNPSLPRIACVGCLSDSRLYIHCNQRRHLDQSVVFPQWWLQYIGQTTHRTCARKKSLLSKDLWYISSIHPYVWFDKVSRSGEKLFNNRNIKWHF